MIFRCKNFFKRSVVMTQKKPYICNNQNNCDVRIVIDMSGIKRKGARCQACRYIACLDAGMYHSGITEQLYQQIIARKVCLMLCCHIIVCPPIQKYSPLQEHFCPLQPIPLFLFFLYLLSLLLCLCFLFVWMSI